MSGKAEEIGNLGAEHKPGTYGNVNSAIKQHAETGHDIHPSHQYASILDTGVSGIVLTKDCFWNPCTLSQTKTR